MDDYLSRSALREAFASAGVCFPEEDPHPNSCPRNKDEFIGKVVRCVPAADVEPIVSSHWVVLGRHNFACAVCHARVSGVTPRCPYCGARMAPPMRPVTNRGERG